MNESIETGKDTKFCAAEPRRTFDRSTDVPKIVGCNTRNIEYRWKLFERHLARLPRGAAVLDFGAGSLRESYEMYSRGFAVTAIDLDANALTSYVSDYDWTRGPGTIEILTDDFHALRGRKFSLILAFDVFEHLDRPADLIDQMRDMLAPGGVIFCTVPNRRTLFEIVLRVHWKIGLARGRVFTPGEPHIQFKSPREWRQFFSRCGLEIVEHDMAIGFLVNTWAAIVTYPTMIVRRLFHMPAVSERDLLWPFGAKPVMRALGWLDQRTVNVMRGCWGWNLFVLAKSSQGFVE